VLSEVISRVGQASPESPKACNCAVSQNMPTTVFAPMDSGRMASSRKVPRPWRRNSSAIPTVR
jgi:hypothetical protein